MAKTKTPFFSLGAHGSVGGSVTAQKRNQVALVRVKPFPTDPKSTAQLAQRARYLASILFWNGLSVAQKQAWLTAARPFHMPGMSLFIRRYMPLTRGLQLYYPLNDYNSALATDFGILDTPGVIYGATPVDGYFGGALDFDNINDWVNCSTGLTATLNASFTLAAWTKRASKDAIDVLFCHGDADAAHHQLVLRYDANNKFRFSFTADDLVTAIAYPDLDTWTRWLVTYDHATNARRIFRNKVIVANDIATQDYQGTTSAFVIGRKQLPLPVQYFDGIFDEPMAWDRVLPQVEIDLDYERGTP